MIPEQSPEGPFGFDWTTVKASCDIGKSVPDSNIYWNSYLPIFFDRMNACMRKHMTGEVSDYGLTSAHAVYLIALVLNGPMTQREMSAFLDMDAANTNRVVKTLREKGMVYDDRASPDARNYRIHLTEIGRKLGKKVMDSTSKWMDDVMSVVPREDVLNMRSTLLRVLNEMDPDLEDYMNSKYTNQFYTYLHSNPEGEKERFFVSGRVRDRDEE